MKLVLPIALVAVAATLAGCATAPPKTAAAPKPQQLSCAPGEHSAEVAQLFFGRNIGQTKAVSEADWEAFLDRELTGRFPEGLSVIDTAGVWRGQDGAAIHELGKAVVIVLSGKDDELARIDAVTNAYKAKFSQESVLTARSQACVAF